MASRKSGGLVPNPGSVINRGHPLAQGLVVLLPFNNNGGQVDFNLVDGNTAQLVNNPAWAPCPGAARLSPKYNGSNTYATLPYRATYDCSTGITLRARLYLSATSFKVIWGKPYATTHTAPYFDYCIYRGLGSAFNFRIGGTDLAGPSLAGYVGRFVDLVCTADGVNRRWYVDGVLKTTTADSLLPTNTNSRPLRVAANAAVGEVYDERISDVALWNRALTGAEVAQIYADPFVYVDPPEPSVSRYFFGDQSGIQFRSAQASASTAGALTLTAPAGVVDGDVLVMFVGIRPTTSAPTPPLGWTTLASQGTNPAAAIFWKIASGEPSSYTVTFATSDNSAGVIVAISGAIATALTSAQHSIQRNAAIPVAAAALGSWSVANGIDLFLAVKNTTGATPVAPTGYTQPANHTADSGGTGITVDVSYKTLTGVTTVGTLSSAWPNDAPNVAGHVFIFESGTQKNAFPAALAANAASNQPAAGVSPNVSAASASTTAYNPTVTAVPTVAPNAGLATVTAAGQTARTSLAPSASVATASAAAQVATAAASPNAGSASSTATAFDPTITAQANAFPDAGLATVSVVGQTATPAVSPSAPAASAPATANAPSTSLAVNTESGTYQTSILDSFGNPITDETGASILDGWSFAVVASQTPIAKVAPSAGASSATAGAYNPTVNANPTVSVSAGLATVTATGLGPVASLGTSAGAASVTATANNPSFATTANVTAAAAAATAQTATANPAASVGAGSVSASGQNPTAAPSAIAQLATITAPASDATVATQNNVNTSAFAAIATAATGAASASTALAVNTDPGTHHLAVTDHAGNPITDETGASILDGWSFATADAQTAAAGVSPVAGAGSGTAGASNASNAISPNAGVAAPSAASQTPNAAVAVNVVAASATATSYAPTISAAGITSPAAGLAAALATGRDASNAVYVSAGLASASAIARDGLVTSGETTFQGGIATALGIANDPSTQLGVSAGRATPVAIGYNPTILAEATTPAAGGLAETSATAHSPTISVQCFAGAANATATSIQAGTALAANAVATTVAATGIAPAASIAVNASRASLFAVAYNAHSALGTTRNPVWQLRLPDEPRWLLTKPSQEKWRLELPSDHWNLKEAP